MSKIDKKYHKLLTEILDKGYRYEDPNRKNVFRKQISDYKIVHDFSDGFPALTTKALYWKGVVGELLWILRGDTNIKYLVDNDINIWNKDAYNYYKKTITYPLPFTVWLDNIKSHSLYEKSSEIGRGYGAQLRSWKGIENIAGVDGRLYESDIKVDQFAELINTLKTNPMATKKTVTFWNPAEKEQCSLTPCHWSFEILVEPLSVSKQPLFKKDNSKKGWTVNDTRPKYQFTLKWHQHSVDTFLGLPFNIASYALLAHIIGKMTNMVPKGIIGDLSNVHIYEPHMDAVKKQLSRNANLHGKSELNVDMLDRINMDKSVDHIVNMAQISDFELLNYTSYPRIPAEMLAYSN